MGTIKVGNPTSQNKDFTRGLFSPFNSLIEIIMDPKLRLYAIDMKYVRYLSNTVLT